MAIEILKQKREELRNKARVYDARYHHRGGRMAVSVRTWNCLRDCAKLTVAILALQHAGL